MFIGYTRSYMLFLLLSFEIVRSALVGNYQLWDYYTPNTLWDYGPTQSRHATVNVLGTSPIVTDRGIFLYDKTSIDFPTFPVSTEVISFSMWFYPLNTCSIFTLNPNYGKPLTTIQISGDPISLTINSAPNSLPTTLTLKSWRLFTISMNKVIDSTILSVFSNSDPLDLVGMNLSGYDFKTDQMNWSIGSSTGSMNGYLYEVWWYDTTVPNFNDLISPIGCVLSPYLKCLSSQEDPLKSSAGDVCSCGGKSCKETKKCIDTCNYACLSSNSCRSITLPICKGVCDTIKCKCIPNTDRCYECNTGYIFESDICVHSVPKCITYKNTYQCSRCDIGYYLKDAATCSQVSNCKTYNLNGTCNVCQDGYYKQDVFTCPICTLSDCLKCIFSTTQKCILCGDSFWIQPLGTCAMGCPIGYFKDPRSGVNKCSICTDGCLECEFDAILNKPYCTKCPTTPETFLIQPKTSEILCDTICPLNSFTSVDRCINCSLNCNTCSSETTCTQCKAGYFLNSLKDGSVVCEYCTISQCKLCQNVSTCAECNNNYHLTTVGYTLGCKLCEILYCSSCSSYTVCGTCIKYYYRNIISETSVTCGACSSNCDICTNDKVCTSCRPRTYWYDPIYFLTPFNDGSVVCRTCEVPNCTSCSSYRVCNSCNIGYYMKTVGSEVLCEPCSSYCNYCIDSITCTSCSNNYLLSNIDGSVVCRPCEVSNCSICLSYRTCGSCAQSYYKTAVGTDVLCSSCPSGCYSCTSDTYCTSCYSNYVLITDNSSKLCLKCEITNCNTCSTITACNTCQTGYYRDIISADNIPCSQCLIPYCTVCQTGSICNSCEASYYLNKIADPKVDCQPCKDTCSACSSYSLCTSCKFGNFLKIINSSNQDCIACTIANCDYCQDDFNCSICKYNYDLTTIDDKTRKCYTCRGMNCIGCARDYECKACNSGYFLKPFTDGLIYKIKCEYCTISYCTQCLTDTKCGTCLKGYYLNTISDGNVICTICPGECTACVSLTYCTECQPGYYIKVVALIQECSRCVIDNCRRCFLGTNCIECFSGFTLYNKSGQLTCTLSCDADNYLTSASDECIQRYSSTSIRCTPFATVICNTCSESDALISTSLDACVSTSCPVDCIKCITTTGIAQCQVCKNGYYMTQDKTQCFEACPDEYYVDIASKICYPCTSDCLKCPYNPSICAVCKQTDLVNYFLKSDSTCSSNCPEATFKNYSTYTCDPCLSNCKTCTNSKNCSECVLGYYLFKDTYPTTCISSCSIGYYAQQIPVKECRNCNIERCIMCEPDLSVSSGLSCTRCTIGYVARIDNYKSECVKANCPAHCEWCIIRGNDIFCYFCSSGYFLQPSRLSCETFCPDYYYSDGTKCQPCPSNCKICKLQPELTCIECEFKYFLQPFKSGLECQLNCPISYYPDSSTSTCKKCKTECQVCSSLYECTSCASGYFLQKSGQERACKSTCPAYTYAAIKSLTCKDCPFEKCIQCTSKESLQCESSYVLYGETLCQNCPSNCEYCKVQNEQIECIQCNPSYYLNPADATECITKCPRGYRPQEATRTCTTCPDRSYSLGDQCLSCGYLCQSCNGSMCLECVEYANRVSNKECSCIKHFREVNNDCMRYYLTVEILPISKNSTMLSFNSPLEHILSSSDIIVWIGSRSYDSKYFNITAGSDMEEFDMKFYDVNFENVSSVEVVFIDVDSVRSTEGNTLNITHYEVLVHSSTPKPNESISTPPSRELKAQTQTIVIATTAASAALSLMGVSLSILWNTLNTIQLFSYIPLLNIYIPDRLASIFQGFSLFYNPITPISTRLNASGPSLQTRYVDLGMETSMVLFNSDQSLSIFLVFATAYLFSKLLVRYTSKLTFLHLKLVKLVQLFEWNIFLRFWLEAYLEISITSMVNIYYGYFNSDIHIASFCIAVLMTILNILFPIYLIHFILKTITQLDTEEFLKPWSTLFENINIEKIENCMNIVYFCMFRLGYAAIIVFLENSGYIQVVGMSIITYTYLVYVGRFRPMKDKVDSLLTIYNEACCFVVFTGLGVFVYKENEELNEIADIMLSCVVYGSIAVPNLVGFARVAIKFGRYCKNRFIAKAEEKCLDRINQENPTFEQSSHAQSESKNCANKSEEETNITKHK